MPRTMGIESGEPAQTERQMIDATEAAMAEARIARMTPPHPRATRAVPRLGSTAVELDPDNGGTHRQRPITIASAHSPATGSKPTEPFTP
jgi:hypothetical protein